MVWTDLKLDNFILIPTIPLTSSSWDDQQRKYYQDRIFTNEINKNFYCKAIDLESAVSSGSKITDFSAENLSPELYSRITESSVKSVVGKSFGDIQLDIDGFINVDEKTDVWGLGIAILHLYFGR